MNKIIKKINVSMLLIIIVLLGAFLRFYKLGETSFNSDEFLDINSSFAYAQTGVWQNWDFNFEKVNSDNIFEARDERAWIYKGQVAQLLKVFPPTESVARTVSVFWGIISIILIFFVAKYFSKKNEVALISSFLFAISVSGIIFDRTLRMYAMFFAVFLAFSWFLFKFLEEEYKGKNKFIKYFWDKAELNLVYFIPMVVMGIVSLLTHQLTANILFIFLFYAIIQVGLKIKNKKSYFDKYFFGLLVMLVGYVSGLIFMPERLNKYSKELDFFKDHFSYLGKVFSDYNNAILAVIFLALGIYYLCKKQKLQKESAWLATSFLGTLFLAIFIWDRNAGDQYIFFIQSFGIILIASGIYYAAIYLKENMAANKDKVFLSVIILALVLLPNYGYFIQNENTYHQTSQSDNPDFRKIFSYFKKAREPQDVLISRKVRNYYWGGEKVKLFDFGGELAEEKLSLDQLKKITTENPSGWFIYTDNDESYIANDAITYAEKNFEKVSNVKVRGKVSVYRWGHINNEN